MALLGTAEHRAYVLRETSVSVVINAVFSAFFAWLVFGGEARISLWGTDGLALDFLPQSFVITLMAVFVPSTLARKRIRDGALASATDKPPPKLPRNLFLRALLIAALATPVATAIIIAILAATTNGSLPYSFALTIKVFYGAALACVVTAFAVRAACREWVATR